jgi:hypothetical protein
MFPDLEDVVHETLSIVLIEAIELYLCRRQYLILAADLSDVTPDGNPLCSESDVAEDADVIIFAEPDKPPRRHRHRPRPS